MEMHSGMYTLTMLLEPNTVTRIFGMHFQFLPHCIHDAFPATTRSHKLLVPLAREVAG